MVRDTRGSGSPGRGPFPSPGWGAGFRGSPGRTGHRGARAGGSGAGLAETKASGTRPFPRGLPWSPPCGPGPPESRAPQSCTGAGGDRVMACKGQELGTPSGPAPKLGAGMTKYGACARERAGRKELKSSLDPHSC